MASPRSCSDMKTCRKRPRDQNKSHKKTKAKRPRLSNPNPAAMTSNYLGPRVKTSTPNKHCIRDTNQQILVLQGGILVAVPDKRSRKGETFYVSTLQLKRATFSKANHIVLAVSKGKLCLCCDKVKAPKCPSLELKKKNIKELYSLSPQKLLPFTFLKEKAGSYFTLESAANPGYFIYTSSTPGQPVGVTKEIGKKKNTHFEFANARWLSEARD